MKQVNKNFTAVLFVNSRVYITNNNNIRIYSIEFTEKDNELIIFKMISPEHDHINKKIETHTIELKDLKNFLIGMNV